MQTVLQHNDLLVHRVHRHEPPVTAQPLTIVHQDDDIIAINKPSSIPVSRDPDISIVVGVYTCTVPYFSSFVVLSQPSQFRFWKATNYMFLFLYDIVQQLVIIKDTSCWIVLSLSLSLSLSGTGSPMW